MCVRERGGKGKKKKRLPAGKWTDDGRCRILRCSVERGVVEVEKYVDVVTVTVWCDRESSSKKSRQEFRIY